jgi:hypothetical protein
MSRRRREVAVNVGRGLRRGGGKGGRCGDGDGGDNGVFHGFEEFFPRAKPAKFVKFCFRGAYAFFPAS